MIIINISRKEQGKLTKEKIFDTAIKLIREQGYDNISVSQICKEAGVAKGTFYVHYKSKEDIVRESYYSDMGNYVLDNFKKFNENNEDASLKEYIIEFLTLEFKFTEYAGYELTCLAFVTNFSSCIPGPCMHFEKRTFTDQLKKMINDASKQKLLKDNLTETAVFTYLETAVRGMMATWCFSNGDFDIIEEGKKYVARLADTFIK